MTLPLLAPRSVLWLLLEDPSPHPTMEVVGTAHESAPTWRALMTFVSRGYRGVPPIRNSRGLWCADLLPTTLVKPWPGYQEDEHGEHGQSYDWSKGLRFGLPECNILCPIWMR